MPLKIYLGRPRSGKTYEVTKNVIVPAIGEGRRVVTNIAGLNYEAISEYLVSKGRTADKLGKIVTVTLDDINKPDFFRTTPDLPYSEHSFIQPGDVLALDEVWALWKKRGQLRPELENFFRYHGHFTHPDSGQICEIALSTQNLTDINETIRGLVDETYYMTKATNIGQDNKYHIDVYDRASLTKQHHTIRYSLQSYDPAFFAFYKSHSQNQTGVQPIERKVDNRGNLFNGKLFRLFLPVLIILGGWALYWLITSFFNPEKSALVQHKEPTEVHGQPAAAHNPGAPGTAAVTPPATPEPSSKWLITGMYQSAGVMYVNLRGASGESFQLVNPVGQFRGRVGEIELPDGSVASTYSVTSTMGVIPK